MDQYRKTPRANFIDYDNGDFFITICTKNRKHYFGEIIDKKMQLSRIGAFLENQFHKCEKCCNGIQILKFVIMPNHVHAIICIREDSHKNLMELTSPNPALRSNPTCQRHVPTLSKYINSLKGSVTKYAIANNIEFGWQSRYYDHLIRNTADGNLIWEYIANNVVNWQNDGLYES